MIKILHFNYDLYLINELSRIKHIRFENFEVVFVNSHAVSALSILKRFIDESIDYNILKEASYI